MKGNTVYDGTYVSIETKNKFMIARQLRVGGKQGMRRGSLMSIQFPFGVTRNFWN